MGIKDLLKFMKPYIEPVHVKKFAGKRVGIDAYSWLHKGAYSCSMELCLNSDSARKTRYLDYFMHRIDLLRYYEVTPVVVFDGGNMPCKAATEQDRHRKRSANRESAMEKLKNGDVNAASELFQRAVCITPSMAYQLIQVLRSENIEFVVAPYEADAQLAYLSNLEAEGGGIVSVITEDSDLLAYGCPSVIFKMDRYGNGEKVELDRVFDAESCKPCFQKFNKELFTGMCVFAGCDFLPSVPGIGIAKAHSYVSKYRNLSRVLSVLKLEKGNQVPEDYVKSFKEAVAVFQHARIYDPKMKELKHMKPLTEELLRYIDGDLNFLGPEMPPTIVKAIAEGNLNPITMEAFDEIPCPKYRPDPVVLQTRSKRQKTKAPKSMAEDSCFMVFSHSNKEDSAVTRQNVLPKKEKGVNEFLGLEKLVVPRETSKALEEIVLSVDTSLKVPDNNPFKIRKHEEISLPTRGSSSGQLSLAGMSEDMDYLCLSPDDNPYQVADDDSIKRKFRSISTDQLQSNCEQIAVLTEVENSRITCMTTTSQESVNSKLTKDAAMKGRSESERKSKKGNHKNSYTKNTSILNFFSQV